ncbi:hypothetical protein GMRT_11055 [Giardia muris]|uniref:Uncharacterized protein n=1 Tax=Giardia muris TaxID=5742 RepID=A0A4Z1SN63_GIAMU|nr:hypothetical protein GMRT_11055 [Giardia muris]|eukprot:TNJ27156.1 hypothetical protein GMRT_11055 [Giardia muris]
MTLNRELPIIGTATLRGREASVTLPPRILLHGIQVGNGAGPLEAASSTFGDLPTVLMFTEVRHGEYLVDAALIAESGHALGTLTLQFECDPSNPTVLITVYGLDLAPDRQALLGSFEAPIGTLLHAYDSARSEDKKVELVAAYHSAFYAALHSRHLVQAQIYAGKLAALFEATATPTAAGPILDALGFRLVVFYAFTEAGREFEATLQLYGAFEALYDAVLLMISQADMGLASGVVNKLIQGRARYIALRRYLQATVHQQRRGITVDTNLAGCIDDIAAAFSVFGADLGLLELAEAFAGEVRPVARGLTRHDRFHDTPEKVCALLRIVEALFSAHALSSSEHLYRELLQHYTRLVRAFADSNRAVEGQAARVTAAFIDRISAMTVSLRLAILDVLLSYEAGLICGTAGSCAAQFVSGMVAPLLASLHNVPLVPTTVCVSPLASGRSVEGPGLAQAETLSRLFVLVSERSLDVMRHMRHTALYLTTMHRRYVRIQEATAEEDEARQAVPMFAERYGLTSDDVKRIQAFAQDPFSCLEPYIAIANNLNGLLGGLLATLLVCAKNSGTTPPVTVLQTLSDYFYTAAACIGLVLGNLDEVPISGLEAQQEVYNRATSGSHKLVIPPAVKIEFKLSDTVESSLLVYKPLSTDLFRHPNLSNSLLHALSNFFECFCCALAGPLREENTDGAEDAESMYPALLEYYYCGPTGPSFEFLQPLSVFFNTLLASGIILGNRVAHKEKGERVFHCSLTVKDLGLERLTSNELYSVADAIWFFIRYYGAILFQHTIHGDILFACYLIELNRYLAVGSLSEPLLCQLRNCTLIHLKTSAGPIQLPPGIGDYIPTLTLTDLYSTPILLSGSTGTDRAASRRVLGSLQQLPPGIAHGYLVAELVHTAVQRLLAHIHYQMFDEYFSTLDCLARLMDLLLTRFATADPADPDLFNCSRYYTDALKSVTVQLALRLSTRFILPSRQLSRACRSTASLLISSWSVQQYVASVDQQDKESIRNTVRPLSASAAGLTFISSEFVAQLVRSLLGYISASGLDKARTCMQQILAFVRSRWAHLKTIAPTASATLCSFASMCAYLNIIETFLLRPEDAVYRASSHYDITRLLQMPLFLLTYLKAFAGAFDDAVVEQADAERVADTQLPGELLDIITAAVSRSGHGWTLIYAGMVIRAILRIPGIRTQTSFCSRQSMHLAIAMTNQAVDQLSMGGEGDGSLDLDGLFRFSDLSAGRLLFELDSSLDSPPVTREEDEGSLELGANEYPAGTVLRELTELSILPSQDARGVFQPIVPEPIAVREIPHHGEPAELMRYIAPRPAIVFSFSVPFSLYRSAFDPSTLSDDLARKLDVIDGLTATYPKQYRLPRETPTFSRKGSGEAPLSGKVTYCGKLANETRDLVTAPPVEGQHRHVSKSNELARRLMSREQREQRARELLECARAEFETESDEGDEERQDRKGDISDDPRPTTQPSIRPSSARVEPETNEMEGSDGEDWDPVEDEEFADEGQLPARIIERVQLLRADMRKPILRASE